MKTKLQISNERPWANVSDFLDDVSPWKVVFGMQDSKAARIPRTVTHGLVKRDAVVAMTDEVVRLTRSLILQKVAVELPPKIAGLMDLEEIRRISRQVREEVEAILANGFRGWHEPGNQCVKATRGR